MTPRTRRGAKLPRGVTKRNVAKGFKIGYSVMGLGKQYHCEEFVIQGAIRDVMNRLARRRA